MRIVAGSEADFDEVTAVWEASVRATHHFLPEEDILRLRPLIRGQYLAAVDLWCLKDEGGAGAVRGFVGVAGGGVEMLFLHPEFLGRGLGALLLRHAVDVLGARRVDVNEQNPAARRFYERMGFQVAGRSPLDGEGKPFPLLHMEHAGPERG